MSNLYLKNNDNNCPQHLFFGGFLSPSTCTQNENVDSEEDGGTFIGKSGFKDLPTYNSGEFLVQNLPTHCIKSIIANKYFSMVPWLDK